MIRRILEKLSFNKPLTKNRFAKTLIKRLQAADGVRNVTFEVEQFRLIVDGQQYVNLANFYDEHLRLEKAERENHIANILQGIFQSGFELPVDFEDARHDLLPKVWPRSAFDRLDLQAKVDGREPLNFATVPLGDHHYLGLVYDLPKSVRTIGGNELDMWGVTLEEAFETAKENLRSRPMTVGKIGPENAEDSESELEGELGDSFTPPHEYMGEAELEEDIEPDGRVYLFVTGDSYDATRLILLNELKQMELAGDPVAISPNRDALLVAGSNDEQALTALAALAAQMYEAEPRPHVPIPLSVDDEGRWFEFRVTPDHPAYKSFHALEVKYLAEEYNEQKPLLEKLYADKYLKREGASANLSEAANAVPFVASLLVAESADGEFESHAVWAEHLETLLPKADVVAFMKQSEDSLPIQIPWTDVVAVLDDLLIEVPDHYPPRYQVNGFPSDLALKILTEDCE